MRGGPLCRAVVGGLAVMGSLACGGYYVPEPIVWSLDSTQTWISPLYRDSSMAAVHAHGRIRVRKQHWIGTRGGDIVRWRTQVDLFLSARGLDSVRNYVLDIPTWSASWNVASNQGGGLEVRARGASSVPPPGIRILLEDGSGNPVMAGLTPDWESRPREAGPYTDDADAPAGGETVHIGVTASTRSGRERLDFRMAGFEPGAGVELFLERGPQVGGFELAGGAEAGARGGLDLRWISRWSDPLPQGEVSVLSLRGRRFQVRVGGVTVVAGEVP